LNYLYFYGAEKGPNIKVSNYIEVLGYHEQNFQTIISLRTYKNSDL